MNDSDPNEGEQVIDAEDKYMWGTVTLNFIKEKVTNNIVFLNLASNHITFESAEILAKHIKTSPNLKYLDISETRLTQKATDVIFASISESSLIELYADNNIFPEPQCKILSKSLASNPPLQVLSLCACDIPCEGGVAIAESLGTNTHLLHLRLESNSLYDTAAIVFGQMLPKSSIISLNIADNEIWSEGTNKILECLKSTKIESLDISYNIIDVNTFCSEMNKTHVKKLAVSGCKIDEQLLSVFLNKIPSLKLQTLILDSFNFQILPISWKRTKDTLWETRTCFDDLLLALQQSPELDDLRVGFFQMEQIFGIKRLLEDFPPRRMTVSMHDFGHTDNCWIVHLPELKFESPTTTFRWNSPITVENSPLIGEIIKNTSVTSETQRVSSSLSQRQKTARRKQSDENDNEEEENKNKNNDDDDATMSDDDGEEEEERDNEKEEADEGGESLNNEEVNLIDTLDLHDMKLDDSIFCPLLEILQGFNLTLLDCSDNNLGDASLNSIHNFLKEAKITELDFSGNVPSDTGCESFVRNLIEEEIQFPLRLNLCFKSDDTNQLAEHSTPVQLANLLRSDAQIESLYLGGPVTVEDAICIVDALPQNSHILELEFQSDHIKNYTNPDPEIDPEIQQRFAHLTSLLLSALSDKKSLSKLRSFIFPMMTEVYIYDQDICSNWQEVEKKMAANAKKKKSK